ncbi:MAG TPA: MarR family transcriptional regulator [Candidatus Paceibacterota bacterium]|nr:MarR family transcriptional regulator [Candidatus Paceibacterota bacterium]
MERPGQKSARDILETVPPVMRFIRDQIRQHCALGLSLPQVRTLAFLDRARNSSLSALAGHLGLTLPATSRLINGLVKDGLAKRQPVATNRRQVALMLTERGRATLETARNEIRRRLAGALKPLSAAEHEKVQRALQVLHQIFEPTAPDGNSATQLKA